MLALSPLKVLHVQVRMSQPRGPSVAAPLPTPRYAILHLLFRLAQLARRLHLAQAHLQQHHYQNLG
jgi:hypothetical protein